MAWWPFSETIIAGGLLGALALTTYCIGYTAFFDREAFSYGTYALVPFFAVTAGWLLGASVGAVAAFAVGAIDKPDNAVAVAPGWIVGGTVAAPFVTFALLCLASLPRHATRGIARRLGGKPPERP